MGSNYDKQVYRAREIFLQYSQEEMIQKISPEYDEHYMLMQMLNKRYRISRKSGEVEMDVQGVFQSCLDYQSVMILYDSLCYPKKPPHLKGEWCPLASLQITRSPSADRFTLAAARMFSGRLGELEEACGQIGGKKLENLARADVCFELRLLPFFPVIFQFWEKDEEFEPRIVFLWDRNSLEFLHFETLYYGMNHILGCLQREM